jgi:hypothetical protein
MLIGGTFFPPGCSAVPWGRASAPASVAPEASQDHGCSCEVFSQRLVSVRGVSFSLQPASAVPYARIDIHLCSVQAQEV